jgi:diguanylate cyclase (GGDEF)-like protein
LFAKFLELMTTAPRDPRELFDRVSPEAIGATSNRHINQLHFPDDLERSFQEYYDSKARTWIYLVGCLLLIAFAVWVVIGIVIPLAAIISGEIVISILLIGSIIGLIGISVWLLYRYRRGRVRRAQRIIVCMFVPVLALIAWLRLLDGENFSAFLPLFLARLVLPLMLRLRFADSLPPIIALTVLTQMLFWASTPEPMLAMLTDSLAMTAIALLIIYLQEREVRREFFYRAQIHQLAMRDGLTGVNNRRSFFDRLEAAFVLARRHDHPLALLVFDLDHFKQINDRYGHAAGDAALLAIAQMLEQMLRRTDVIGRIGGEEFAVVLMQTELTPALLLAETVRVRMAQLQIRADDIHFTCTASIGVVELTPEDASSTALLRRADRLLYQAKQSGRNRVEG